MGKNPSAQNKFNANSAKPVIYQRDDLPSFFGLNNDLFFAKQREKNTSVTFFPSTGSIQGVGTFVDHNKDGTISLKVEHWLHEPNNKNTRTPFLTIELAPVKGRKSAYKIIAATFQDKALDTDNPAVVSNIESLFTEVIHDCRNERTPPNLIEVAKDYKFRPKSMPGILRTGAARNAYERAGGRPQRNLDVPTDYLDSIIGLDQVEFNTTGKVLKRRSILRNPENKNEHVVQSLSVQRGKNSRDRKTYVSAEIGTSDEVEGLSDIGQTKLFDLVLRPKNRTEVEPHLAVTSINSLNICGADIDKKNHKDLVRGINLVRDYAVPTLAGVPTDPQEIIRYTHLQEELSPLPEMTPAQKSQSFIRAIGGNPTEVHVKHEEEGIGANAWHIMERVKTESGQIKETNFGIDAGIKPLNTKKTGYDGFFTYLGDYFPHRTNKKHKPKFPTKDWLVTERHIDHIDGLAYAIMSGYKIDNLYLSATSANQLTKLLQSNAVDKDWYPNFKIIENNSEFKIGSVKIKTLETAHSTKSFAYHMTFANGATHLHMGDSKLAQVVTHGEGSDQDFLDKLKQLGPVDSFMMDTTRATQDDQSRSEGEVAKDMNDDFADAKAEDKNIIVSQIGSNLPRLMTELLLSGKHGYDMMLAGDALYTARRQLNIKCIEDENRAKLKDEMEALGFGADVIARVMKADNTFDNIAKALDVKVVNYSKNGKKAKEMLDGESDKPHIVVCSGSHFEPKSWMHRLLERTEPALKNVQNDKYCIIGSQYAIPGNEKNYNAGYADLERRGFKVTHHHTSGHDGLEGWRKMTRAMKPKFGITGHGDREQRQAGVDFMVKEDIKPIDPTEQDFIEIKPGKLDIVAQGPSVRIYYRYQRPEDQYYGSVEVVDFYASKSQPALRNDAGRMISKAHEYMEHPQNKTLAKSKDASKLVVRSDEVEDIMLNITEANLVPKEHYVTMSLPDWKISNGILNEFMYDVETTGLGPFARTHQFAAIRRDNDLKVSENINIRCKLDKHILFDLEGMIATGTMPDNLYSLGVSQREFAMQMYNSFEKMRNSESTSEPTAGASKVLYIDKTKPANDPRTRVAAQKKEDAKNPPSEDELRKRQRRVHPYMRKSLKYAFEKAALPGPVKRTFIKGLVGGYNNTGFDDPRIRMECFAAGYSSFFPTNRGQRRFDTRNVARAFHHFRPDRFKVQTKGETDPNCPDDMKDMMDFTVKGLALANKIRYSEDAAHDANYDVDLQFRLLDHMRKIDPDLYTQMMMNTDKAQIKGFLRGAKNGHVYQRPLISYIDNRAKNAQRHVGFMVGTSNRPALCNKAVLFNAEDFDPRVFEDMSQSDIAEIMSSPDHHLHKAFNIIDISKNPIVAEAERSFRLGTVTPKEQIKERKRYVERNPVLAKKIISALETARYIPDGRPYQAIEKRILNLASFKLSPKDQAIAPDFEPIAQEFTDESFAKALNKHRATLLDSIESNELRERYVMQLYSDSNGREYLHPEDYKYARAVTRAYFCGEITVDSPFQTPVSIYQLKKQIDRAKVKYADDIAEGNLTAKIIEQAEEIVEARINDHDLMITPEDREILRLYSPKKHRVYSPPKAKNDNNAKPPKRNIS